ncbi:MAG: aspartyl protease family protein [Terracidiphilus sp.]
MLIRQYIAVIGIVLAASSAPLAAQSTGQLRQMLDANRAFALRDAVEDGHAPAFYRGAVEDSMNRIGAARRDLKKAIEADPHSHEAFEAHEMLANMSFRNGHYREALAELEAAHGLKPDSADVNNFLPLLRALGAWPAMLEAERRSSRFRMTGDERKWLPATMDGKKVAYGFDSGAVLSVMGRADAKMLGLEVRHVNMQLSEASGKAVPGVDVALVRDLRIGGLHLRNVPFFVMQDTGEPFAKMAVGTRGLIGLPVLLAMQAVQWDSSGWFTFGNHARFMKPAAQNLLFHGSTAIVQLTVEGKPLTFSLDTGAVDTDLNEGFAKALPDLLAAGKKESLAITGMGGSVQYESVLLGPITFSVGGRDVTLKSPHVFPAHSLGSFDGNLGHDILDQANSVTIDFRRMALQLR